MTRYNINDLYQIEGQGYHVLSSDSKFRFIKRQQYPQNIRAAFQTGICIFKENGEILMGRNGTDSKIQLLFFFRAVHEKTVGQTLREWESNKAELEEKLKDIIKGMRNGEIDKLLEYIQATPGRRPNLEFGSFESLKTMPEELSAISNVCYQIIKMIKIIFFLIFFLIPFFLTVY